jgi:hypothetical protein
MPTSAKWILLVNLMLVAVIYVVTANAQDVGLGFVFGIFLAGANLVLAFICLLIYVIQLIRDKSTGPLLSLVITFFLSTIVVILVSFHSCYLRPPKF